MRAPFTYSMFITSKETQPTYLMKITQEHYQHLVTAMAPLTPQVPAHRENVRATGKFKDLEKRVRWDWARAAKLIPFFCDTLYTYLNDDHIDTALRSVVKQLETTEA